MTTEQNTTTTASDMPEKTRGSDVYQIVTDRIIELLEQGTVPWHKPWSSDERFPMNLASGKQYRGLNVFLLHVAGYGSPYWLTFNQIKARGGFVKAGEKSSMVTFFKPYETTDKVSGEKKTVRLLRYYRVFNVEQTEGVDYPKPEARAREFEPIAACEQIVADMPKRPQITHGEARAYYRPSADVVNMPKRELFDSEAEYYSTEFHELAHSTGHESRLHRFDKNEGDAAFGSGSYAREELVAEMTASFLCGTAGIENKTINNSASYIANWLERLRNDRKLVVRAASQAQKAADFILGKLPAAQPSESTNEASE